MDARRTSIAGRLVEPAREALLPFVLARVVVLGVLALAHFIVDRTDPAHVGVAARVHEGLLGWDAGFYETIARVGYAAMGTQSLRFYPAVPALTHAVAWLPGVGDGAALLVVSNVAAYVATVLLYILVRRETRDALVARRAIWFLSLAPAAYVLVMGYAESTLLCLAIGCFLALRPAPAPDPGLTSGTSGGTVTPPNFALAGVLAFVAALTRPIGVLLALVVAVELVRWWVRLGRGRRVAGLAATVAPVVGLALFGVWSQHEVGDFWAPLSVQFQSSHHGALADPVVTVYHDVRGLWHGHVGTALHVPWVVLAADSARGLLAQAPGVLHRVLGRGPARRRRRVEPRFVRALRPQRVSADHCGRPGLREARGRAGGARPPARRTGGVRAPGVPEHLGSLTGPILGVGCDEPVSC